MTPSNNYARLSGILLLLLLLGAGAYAQRPTPTRPPVTTSPDVPPSPPQPLPTDSAAFQQQLDEVPDTVGIFYFFADNPNQETPFSDSLLFNFQQYDPVRQRNFDYAHLGNLGSAHRPIVHPTSWRRGFDIGLHQFDLYLLPAHQMPFYRLQKAFTNASFMVGSEQADSYLTTTFSRNFARGLNFTFDYKRISQLGRQNQYPNQNTRNTSVGTGFWLQGKGGRYQGFLSITGNAIEHEDNGGIAVEPDFEAPNAALSSADVFLNNAQTRHQHRELAYTQYFQIGGKPDSIKGFTRAFTAIHQLLAGDHRYKFFDRNVVADSTFFDWFPQLRTDVRGVRHYLQHRQIENSFRLRTFRLRKGKASDVRTERDLLEAGLVHSIHFVGQEPRDSVINNLFLTGRWNVRFGERLRLETYGHLGFFDNLGDYRVQGNLQLDFGKLGRLEGEFINQLYSPTLLQHRFYLSQRPVWENNFRQTLETTIGGTYVLPALNLRVTGRYHLLNNYIYFDTLALPQQTSIPISILQLLVQQNFKFWFVHIDNMVALQNTSSDLVRLPRVFAKHSLYYEGYWFKVLNVKLGFDLRYNDTYFATYYNPVTGQFQLQNQQAVAFYPALDGFFSMRVTRFRAFAKMENLTNILLADRLFYQTAFYAHPRASFRMGIKWRLTD